MRFLFYDCVKTIEKGRRIVAVKTFPLSEEFLGRHFTRKPCVPAPIIIEAMAQVVGWLDVHAHDFQLSAILSLVEGVKLPHALLPGAAAEIHGELISTSKRDALGRARVLVAGHEVASLDRIIFAHFQGAPPEELRRRFEYYGGFRAPQAAAPARPPAQPDRPRRVVVTGLGMATPLGLGAKTNWRRALAGESAIRRVDLPGAASLPAPFAGQIHQDDWDRMASAGLCDASREPRSVVFALQAASEALEDAGLTHECPLGPRAGVILGGGLGVVRLEDLAASLDPQGAFDLAAFAAAKDRLAPDSLIASPADRPAALIARRFGAQGPASVVTSACAASTQAIGAAMRAIRFGQADLMITGGADSMINPIGEVFFVLLGAASVAKTGPENLCKPFDRRRTGMVMGEGAGVLVLESEEHALARGARIYAVVAGYGASFDSYRITTPHPEGTGAAAAMTAALRDASLTPADIDYINAHGTSTKLNDPAETQAIITAFGDHASALCVSSSKSLFGHLIGGCGGPEFVFTVLSVATDRIHPTINLTQADPKCSLDYVPNVARQRVVRAALSASFGFGGQNAAVIAAKHRPAQERP